MEKVLVLGASGSLGTQVVNYLSKSKVYKVEAVTGWHNTKKIQEMSDRLNCIYAHKNSLRTPFDLVLSQDWDIIINCVSGIQGVELSWLAAKKTRKLILGNKETLFVNGKSFLEMNKCLDVIPLDSELTSLWYMKRVLKMKSNRLFITASGGSLFSKKDLQFATKDTILKHPVWKMGEQITIDSSTMVNKLFELYSASVYFNINLDKIDVYICRSGNIHAGLKADATISLNYEPTMENAIRLIFDNGKYLNSPTKDTNLNELKEVDTNIYPLYELKDSAFLTIKKRCKLLSLSLSLGRDFILGRFSFEEMINIIKGFFQK